MESFCHSACLYWDIRNNGSYYYDYLDLRCYISWIFFSIYHISETMQCSKWGEKKTQPPKSAKILLSNETKVICSLPSLPCFFLVLPEVESISASSTEWQHLWETLMSGQRLGLFLTNHHQYKHEDLRADSQCLCKRRAMNKSFAIIYILILENHKP